MQRLFYIQLSSLTPDLPVGAERPSNQCVLKVHYSGFRGNSLFGGKTQVKDWQMLLAAGF
jgi:hypothetical protein